MTRKRAFFVAQLAAGMEKEAAAASAGYGEAYARKLFDDPQTLKAVEQRREYMQEVKAAQAARKSHKAAAQTPMEVLKSLAMDPLQDPRVRISAVRAMAGLDDRRESMKDVVQIIDDIRDELEETPDG